MLVGVLALGSWAAGASAVQAQVFIRAPFVRVQVGPGVNVRVPFFSFSAPAAPPPLYGPPPAYVYPPNPYVPPQPGFVPPQPGFVPPAPPPVPPIDPAPPGNPAPNPPANPPPAPANPNDLLPPAPVGPVQAMTLDQFAKQFQPKAGAYEIDLVNPVTKQP